MSALPANETIGTDGSVTLELNASYFKRSVWEWLFAVLVMAGGVFAFVQYQSAMDVYEKGILLGAMPAAIWLGWLWKPLQRLMLVVAAFSLLGINTYQNDLARAETVFWLKYFLSSQSAILWMSMLFFMATLFYWIGVFAKGRADGLELLLPAWCGLRSPWHSSAPWCVGTRAICWVQISATFR